MTGTYRAIASTAKSRPSSASDATSTSPSPRGPSIDGPTNADHDQVVAHGRLSNAATTTATPVVAASQPAVRIAPPAMSVAALRARPTTSHSTIVTGANAAVRPSTSDDSAM